MGIEQGDFDGEKESVGDFDARLEKQKKQEEKKERERGYEIAEAELRKKRAGIGEKEEHERMVEFDEDFEKGIRP